eukprot:6080199-Alexandrium_andersonii.AAC.1
MRHLSLKIETEVARTTLQGIAFTRFARCLHQQGLKHGESDSLGALALATAISSCLHAPAATSRCSAL